MQRIIATLLPLVLGLAGCLSSVGSDMDAPAQGKADGEDPARPDLVLARARASYRDDEVDLWAIVCNRGNAASSPTIVRWYFEPDAEFSDDFQMPGCRTSESAGWFEPEMREPVYEMELGEISPSETACHLVATTMGIDDATERFLDFNMFYAAVDPLCEVNELDEANNSRVLDAVVPD